MTSSDEKFSPTFYILLGFLLTILGYIIGYLLFRAVCCLYRYRYPLPGPDSSGSDEPSLKEDTGSAPSTNKISTTTTQFGHSKSDMDRDIGYSTYV